MTSKRQKNSTIKTDAVKAASETRVQMQSRLRKFYVIWYEMNAEPDVEIPDVIDMSYTVAPGMYFTPDLTRLLITIDISLFPKTEKGKENKRILCRIKTRTEFDIKGYSEKDIERMYSLNQFSIDVDALRGNIMTAVSTTRGALSLVSGGKFIVSIIEPEIFKLENLHFAPTTDVNEPRSLIVTEENKASMGEVKTS